jgi:hypothetical protein
MITPSYGLTANERVLPKLALDFTTASLDPRVTFTRTGNTATVVNSSGYVVPINADLPRFDYDPVTKVCNGLLIEESRTNISIRSEEFGSWAPVRALVSADQATAPDGTLTADKLIASTGANTHLIYITTSGAAATYTASVFAKKAEEEYLVLQFPSGFGFPAVTYTVIVNLNNGTANASGGETGCSFSVKAFNDGWYRVSITRIATGTVTRGAYIGLTDNASTFAFTGDDTSGIYIWGAQLEAGAFPTSYIPTEASQVTRTADVATMTGTNFSDWFNASEGTFSVSANVPFVSANKGFLQVNDGTTSNRLELRFAGSVATTSRYEVVTSGSSVASLIGGNYDSSRTMCAAYATDNFGCATNADVTLTDILGGVPSVNQIRIGSLDFGSSNIVYLGGTIQKISYWPQRLTNAEVQAFSKG